MTIPKPETIIQKVVIPRGAPIIIPNAENLPPEEIKRLKHNEKIRRYEQRKKGKDVTVNVPKQTLRKMDTAEMIEMSKDTRNLAIQTLNKKLLELYDDEEQLNKVNLATLATVFGILFDKAQLAAGLSTQNIAISAKVDITMSADKAPEELNKMREKFNEEQV